MNRPSLCRSKRMVTLAECYEIVKTMGGDDDGGGKAAGKRHGAEPARVEVPPASPGSDRVLKGYHGDSSPPSSSSSSTSSSSSYSSSPSSSQGDHRVLKGYISPKGERVLKGYTNHAAADRGGNNGVTRRSEAEVRKISKEKAQMGGSSRKEKMLELEEVRREIAQLRQGAAGVGGAASSSEGARFNGRKWLKCASLRGVYFHASLRL